MPDPPRAGMRPLRDTLYGDLVWRRPHLLSRRRVLEAGASTLATLDWPRWFSLTAIGACADGRWRFEAPFALRPRVIVRPADGGDELARFARSLAGHGALTMAAGGEFRWRRLSYWRGHGAWTGADDRPLITFRDRFWGTACDMEVAPAARATPALALLVLMGAYLGVLAAARRSSVS